MTKPYQTAKYKKCANFLCNNKLPQYKEKRNKAGCEMYCCRRCKSTCPPLLLKVFKENKLTVDDFMVAVEKNRENRTLVVYADEIGIDRRTLVGWYNGLRDF